MKIFQRYYDFLGIVLVCLIPVLLWLWQTYSSSAFNSLPNSFKSIGQLTALIGATLFFLNFVLAARFKLIENIFNGLNRVYLWHHYLGAISFILLLFHPLFLGTQYLFYSLNLAYQFFFPTLNNYFMWFGIFGLITTIILLIITFYINLHYELWKTTHDFLGLGLVFIILHILFSNGEMYANRPLHWYLLIFSFVAMFSFLYRTLLARFLVRTFKYKVEHVNEKGQDILEIVMRAEKSKLNFDAGQFIFLKVMSSRGIPTEQHPFSISSRPGDEILSVGIKSLGDFTEDLKLLKPEALVQIEGPYGRFLYNRVGNSNQIWIAGGIGITPFMSMAKSLPDSGYLIELFYVVSTKDEAVFASELEKVAAINASIKLHIVATKEAGRLSGQNIADAVPDFKKQDIFLCGPPPMMHALTSQLIKLGVRKTHIHSEEFALR